MIEFSITVKRSHFTVSAQGQLDQGITVLTGSSGSGKSTLIKALAGLVPVESGFIRCDNADWVRVDRHLFIQPQGRQVGYMPQGNIVFPHMTVEANITYSKRGDQALLENLLLSLGIEKYRKQRVSSLSGGEQQRVALARALYSKPKLLLLDEPLSNLDWDLKLKLQTDLQTIIKQWAIPCLWVTHDPEEAARVADHRWSCEEGQLTKLK